MYSKKIKKCFKFIKLIESFEIDNDEYKNIIMDVKSIVRKLELYNNYYIEYEYEKDSLLRLYHLLSLLLEKVTIDMSVENLRNYIKTEFLTILVRNYKIKSIDKQIINICFDKDDYDDSRVNYNCRNMNKIINIKKRSKFPLGVIKILRGWLDNNIRKPYPNREEKIKLAQATSLSILQVENWFINARRRYLK
ncbi:Homeobox protein meis3 [Dictyocoela muelleri]|nr:Homeobox protein meis3 [Dictyocoela muelleri]